MYFFRDCMTSSAFHLRLCIRSDTFAGSLRLHACIHEIFLKISQSFITERVSGGLGAGLRWLDDVCVRESGGGGGAISRCQMPLNTQYNLDSRGESECKENHLMYCDKK